MHEEARTDTNVPLKVTVCGQQVTAVHSAPRVSVED